MAAADEDSGRSGHPPPPLPPLRLGRAFAAAAFCRGGAGVYPSDGDGGDRDNSAAHLRPAIAAAVEGVGIGSGKQTRLVIDSVRI